MNDRIILVTNVVTSVFCSLVQEDLGVWDCYTAPTPFRKICGFFKKSLKLVQTSHTNTRTCRTIVFFLERERYVDWYLAPFSLMLYQTCMLVRTLYAWVYIYCVSVLCIMRTCNRLLYNCVYDLPNL